MYQDVFILGATGNVGRELIAQIETYDCVGHANPTRIVGMANSRGFAFSGSGLQRCQKNEFLAGKNLERYDSHQDFLNLPFNPEAQRVFIDVTASKDVTDFHKKVVASDQGFCMVTANKNPLAYATADEFRELTKYPGRYGYACSVMAGSGAVQKLQDIPDLDDKLVSLEGVLSGTLGYICSALDAGEQLSAIVRQAKEKGYTEPDPRDDLNGLDVARKLQILVNSAGLSYAFNDIQVEPFLPQEYFSDAPIGDFMHDIQQLDDDFVSRVQEANQQGSRLRYVAEMQINDEGNPACSVRLKSVPMQSQIGSLKGTSNLVKVVTSQQLDFDPWVLQAPGAGLATTAYNIRRDLLRLLHERTTW